MEPLTETIDLDIDESNELAFRIKMEGAASSPAKVRLVCEGADFAYMFNGYGTGEPEVVQFTLPKMTSKLSEGEYPARVEVLVENRYFAPLQFQINFKKTLSVVAEAVKVVTKPLKAEIKVSATPIVPQKPVSPSVGQIKFEQKPASTAKALIKNVTEQESPASSPGSLREAYLKKKIQAPADEEALLMAARTMLKNKTGK